MLHLGIIDAKLTDIMNISRNAVKNEVINAYYSRKMNLNIHLYDIICTFASILD